MLDCLVIGGGHCGLLCGDLLARAGRSYQVIDALPRPGDVWRMRPSGLQLFTSRRFCSLAELPMHGDPNGFPSGAEFADHLERFARGRRLALISGVRVLRLSRMDSIFVAELSDGRMLRGRTVVNATGSNQVPIVPPFAASLPRDVLQLTASTYGDPTRIAPGSRVVVVGDGASGRQIAMELASVSRVVLARGRKRKLVNNTLLGRDLFWWLDKTGCLRADRDGLVARLMRRRDPIPVASASDARLRAAGVTLTPRAVGVHGGQMAFGDGSCTQADVVVWCGGYREDSTWMDPPLMADSSAIAQGRGRTPVDGLFVVGRKWLTCRASELVLGAERDAVQVVGYVISALDEQGLMAQDKETFHHVQEHDRVDRQAQAVGDHRHRTGHDLFGIADDESENRHRSQHDAAEEPSQRHWHQHG